MNLEIEIVGARELEGWAKTRPAKVSAFIRTELTHGKEILVAEVQRQLSLGPKDVAATGARVEDYRYPKNRTPHLRVRSGRLRGSVSGRVLTAPPEYEIRVGPQRVDYAGIHEFGGTIRHPGGTRYFFDEDSGEVVFISNRAASKSKTALPITRPHDIPIPARPFAKPALLAKQRELLDRIGRAFDSALE